MGGVNRLEVAHTLNARCEQRRVAKRLEDGISRRSDCDFTGDFQNIGVFGTGTASWRGGVILPTTPSRDDLCCRLLTTAIPSIARGYHRRRRGPYGGQVRRRVRAGHDVDCTSVPAWHYLGPTGKLDGGRRCQGSARGPETPGAGYFGLLTRNKPPPDVLISIKTVGEAPMDATYLRALASRCHRSSRNCSDLFAKEEFRRLATELEATAQELEGPAKFDAAADTWRRSRPSRGYEGDH